jgi:hypothetical protein
MCPALNSLTQVASLVPQPVQVELALQYCPVGQSPSARQLPAMQVPLLV